MPNKPENRKFMCELCYHFFFWNVSILILEQHTHNISLEIVCKKTKTKKKNLLFIRFSRRYSKIDGTSIKKQLLINPFFLIFQNCKDFFVVQIMVYKFSGNDSFWWSTTWALVYNPRPNNLTCQIHELCPMSILIKKVKKINLKTLLY